MRFDGTLNNGEAEATAFGLSGDEGIEQSVTNFRRHSLPAVGDENRDRSIRKFESARRQLVRLKLASFDAHDSTRRRCLDGVQQQVEEGAVHQVLVTVDHEGRNWKEIDHLHARRNAWLRCCEADSVTRDLGEIERFHPRHTSPREVEKFREDSRQAVRLSLNEAAQNLLVFARPRFESRPADS